jgi:hypothetical protein
MCVGVSRELHLVSFANEQRTTRDARSAALAAGMTRLRPVLMTALAMVIGMIPMAIGLGDGGEQNAPLGRSVIGGLVLATVTTLFFVPVMYSLLRNKPPTHGWTCERRGPGFELPPPARSSCEVAIIARHCRRLFGSFPTLQRTGRRPDADRARDEVEVIKPTVLSSDRALELPGTVRPLERPRSSPRLDT